MESKLNVWLKSYIVTALLRLAIIADTLQRLIAEP